jgi:hypothetical protein
MKASSMRRLRAFGEKWLGWIFPDHAPGAPSQAGSVFSRLEVPYTFSPSLSFGGALIAVVSCLARIFSACLLFAIWGGLSALAWSGIGNHFWRAAAVLPLVLLFLVGLATLMIAISAVERMITPKR